MTERVVYLNGNWIPESEAKISIYDEWLCQGWACFEMTRSFFGKTFLLKEHIDRLYVSLRYCGIDPPMFKENMVRLCNLAVEKNALAFHPTDEHRLNITVSPGPRRIYREVAENHPTVCIADFPLRWTVEGFGRYYRQGVDLHISRIQQQNSAATHPKCKHRSRLHFALAALEHPWAVLCDAQGMIAEGAGFNILYVRKQNLCASFSNQALAGISQEYLLKLGQKHGLLPTNTPFDLYDLLRADEVLITGTPFCILPVRKIDHYIIGSGKPGPVFKSLLKDWSATVKVDIEEQVTTWDSLASQQST